MVVMVEPVFSYCLFLRSSNPRVSGAPSLWSQRITDLIYPATLAEMMYILVVLKPRLSYNDWTKLEIFLGCRPTLLMM